MIEIDDVPVLSGLTTVGASMGDLLLNGGDFLIAHLAEFVGLLSLLNRLGVRLEWIPESVISELLTVALLALFVYRVARLATPGDDSS